MATHKSHYYKRQIAVFIPYFIAVLLAITAIFIYLFVDKKEIYLYLGIGASLVLTLIDLVLTVRKQNHRRDKDLTKHLQDIDMQIKKINSNEYEDIMTNSKSDDIAVIQTDLKKTLELLKNRKYIDETVDLSIVPNEYQEGDILSFACFKTKLEYWFKRQLIANIGVVAVYINGETNSEARQKLKNTIVSLFKDPLIGYYDEHTLFCAVAERGSVNLLVNCLERVVSTYVYAGLEDENKVSTCYMGLSRYPYSGRKQIIDHALAALDPQIAVNAYKYDGKINVEKNNTPHISDRFLSMICSLNVSSGMLFNIHSAQDVKEKIVDIIQSYAELLGFSNAGFLVNIPGNNLLKSVYEYKKNPTDTSFSNFDAVDLLRIQDYLSLFDDRGELYGCDMDGLPLDCRPLFNNLGIKSFYHFIINYQGNFAGLIYFNGFEEIRFFNLIDREIMMNVRNVLSSLINIMFSWALDEKYKNIMDLLTKRDEKYIYSFNAETDEIVTVSPNLAKIYPEMQVNRLITDFFSVDEIPTDDMPVRTNVSSLSKVRLGRNLNAALFYSSHGVIEEKYIIIENDKSSKHFDEQIDSTLNILNDKTLIEDIGKELRHEVSGYVAVISLTDLYVKSKEVSQGNDGEIKIMNEVINRLKALGYEDSLYRYSEDTLAIIFFRYPRVEAINSIEKIYSRISKDLVVDGKTIILNYAVSLISYPGDIVTAKDSGKTIDVAIKQTRDMGQNIFYIFGEKNGRKLDRSSYILDVLDEAVKKNKLQFFIQPVINSSTKKPIEGEVLLRLTDPTRGLIPPLEFVPIANKHGRMFEIEQSIIVSIGELWKKYGFGIFKHVGVKRISVNISSDSLNSPTFAQRVEATFKKFKMPKGFLQLEISESTAYSMPVKTKEVMDELKPLGIQFAIDNFGTAPISQFEENKLEFDVVKIDRSIILDIEQNQRSLVTLSYMIDRAKELGCEVIAQGIENEKQLELISDMKIDDYQGYYFSKPLAMNNYIEFLNFKN